MKKTRYMIEVNDGCPWGDDAGYKTLKEAKKNLREIMQEDSDLGCAGMKYIIVKETETDETVYSEEVYSVEG